MIWRIYLASRFFLSQNKNKNILSRNEREGAASCRALCELFTLLLEWEGTELVMYRKNNSSHSVLGMVMRIILEEQNSSVLTIGALSIAPTKERPVQSLFLLGSCFLFWRIWMERWTFNQENVLPYPVCK